MASSPIQLLVFRSGPVPGFHRRLMSTLERLDGGTAISVLDALYVCRHPTGEVEILDMAGEPVDRSAVVAMIDFWVDPRTRRRATESTLGDEAAGVAGPALREIVGALEPGDAVAAVLVEHVWTRTLDDAVSRLGGATVLSRFVDEATIADVAATPIRATATHRVPGFTRSGRCVESPRARSSGSQRNGGHMEEHDRELGPIDIAVIAYPVGAPMTGEAVPLLMDLVDRGIIRVLDVMFVAKDEHGTVTGFEARDLDDKSVGDFALFEGASSGLLGDSDVGVAADALEPGEAGAVIVYENKWAAAFAGAVRRNGGVFIANQRVPLEAILEALDTTEATV